MTEPIDFSLAKDWPLSMLAQRLGLADRTTTHVLLITAISWLPLAVLSIISGLALGTDVKIPFLMDYGVYGRLLFAVPILVIAEVPIGRRTRQVLSEFITAKLIAEKDLSLYYDAVNNARYMKESILSEIIILGFVYLSVGYRLQSALSDQLSTWYIFNGNFTPAGWYYALVSLPLFQFLLLRWIWRLIIWAILLRKISKLGLRLLPIHPDKMGGLAFMGLAQIPFSLIGFAGGAVLSSYLINNIMYRGASLDSANAPILSYVILSTLLFVGPILVFTQKLIELRASGVLEYSDIGNQYARAFHDKWVKGINPEREIILGSSDIQSLADLRNSYDIVQNMNIIAIDRKTILVIAVASAIPMLPIYLIVLPFEEIVTKVLGLIN